MELYVKTQKNWVCQKSFILYSSVSTRHGVIVISNRNRGHDYDYNYVIVFVIDYIVKVIVIYDYFYDYSLILTAFVITYGMVWYIFI